MVPSALCENLGEDLSVVVERETCAGKRVRRGVNRFLARRTEQDLVFEDLKGKEGACIGHLCQDMYYPWKNLDAIHKRCPPMRGEAGYPKFYKMLPKQIKSATSYSL